jgi:putative PIN family toxin of toxin-antitoxin system
MKRKQKRVIVDTNLWISFLINDDYSKLKNLLLKEKIILIVCEDLIEEFTEVAFRPKFKKYFDYEDVVQIVQLLTEFAILIKIKSNVKLCRDEKDNFLLNLAIDSNSDYLVTGDEDLLILGEIEETKIIKMKDFLAIF